VNDLSPYREPAVHTCVDGCDACRALEEELNELKKATRYETLRPYQPAWRLKKSGKGEEQGNPECPFCGAGLYNYGKGGAYRKHPADDRFCRGGFLRRCPRVPHMHRRCYYCLAGWLEKVYEASKGNL
jgi:hypothetical protein